MKYYAIIRYKYKTIINFILSSNILNNVTIVNLAKSIYRSYLSKYT